ncbi:MAG: family 10 glycosylhydrolase [Planctomycetota bacterium]
MNPAQGTPIGEPVYLTTEEKFISEGSVIRESDVESWVSCPDKWVLLEGQCGSYKSSLLYSHIGKHAPAISFKPGLEGVYAIYLAQFSKKDCHAWENNQNYGTYIRMKGEKHFSYHMARRHDYEESFFKIVDLSKDDEIEIAGFDRPSYFDYLKLVPVEKPELPENTGRLIGMCDFTDDVHISKPEDFEAGSCVWRHAEAGFDTILWKAYSVRCEYHTKIGEMRRNRMDKYLDRYDTFKQAVEEAKKAGIEIYGWARISNEFRLRKDGEYDPHPGFKPTTQFHMDNPDKVMRHINGEPSQKLSFAYSEVRKYLIDILCEIAEYGVNGICIDVLRHPPMAMYEKPLVDAFIEKTGQNPMEMPGDGSDEWLAFKATAFTGFLKEAKERLTKQNGSNFKLMVRTMDLPWRNKQAGCDVKTWIDEGIVDEIIFCPHLGNAECFPQKIDLSEYLELAEGKNTEVYASVWRNGSPIEAEYLAGDCYKQGAKGVMLYESNCAVEVSALRENLWRFSRPECLRYHNNG